MAEFDRCDEMVVSWLLSFSWLCSLSAVHLIGETCLGHQSLANVTIDGREIFCYTKSVLLKGSLCSELEIASFLFLASS